MQKDRLDKEGTLIFFCGKMGAGKSTLSKQVAAELEGILLSEDEWLQALFPDEINSFDDYLKYALRLKPLIKSHVQELLKSGTTVVMDFPGNTAKQRAWFKVLCEEHSLPHKLLYLDVCDEQCLENLKKRNRSNPERAHFDTEAVFRQVTSYFEHPTDNESLVIEVVNPKNGKLCFSD